MVPEDHHWKSDYTWMRGGEKSIYPGIPLSTIPYQSSHPDDTLNLLKFGQTWVEGNNQDGNY